MTLLREAEEADALERGFAALGAVRVEADVLLRAETLLDLYGEDIRSRAYLTDDPELGEMVLRPDFTVPVVQAHMESRADPARYTYRGTVFRKQDAHSARESEFAQVGFEVFDGADPAAADADVFAAVADALDGLPVRAATGDIGVLIAAVGGLRTSEARKAALMRHLWRPVRFRGLLDRYAGRVDVPAGRTALLAADDPMADAGPEIGLRDKALVTARIAALREDAAAESISAEEVALIEAILSLRETMPHVISALRDIAVDLPAIAPAVTLMERRAEMLEARGVDVTSLAFEGSYGRTSLEYYDGFVFGFYAVSDALMAPVATGGRYDALTARLGGGVAAPAIGAVVRPALMVRLRGMM